MPAPKDITILETLNIFGIRADYMRQFKEYLEEEGLPSNEERIEFVLPVVKNLDGKKLTTIRRKDGVDSKRQGPKPTLDEPTEYLLKNRVALNWYRPDQVLIDDPEDGWEPVITVQLRVSED